MGRHQVERPIAPQRLEAALLSLGFDQSRDVGDRILAGHDRRSQHFGQVHALGAVGSGAARFAEAEAAVARIEQVGEVRRRADDGLVRAARLLGEADVFARRAEGVAARPQAIAGRSIGGQHVRERAGPRHLLAVGFGGRVQHRIAHQRRQPA